MASPSPEPPSAEEKLSERTAMLRVDISSLMASKRDKYRHQILHQFPYQRDNPLPAARAKYNDIGRLIPWLQRKHRDSAPVWKSQVRTFLNEDETQGPTEEVLTGLRLHNALSFILSWLQYFGHQDWEEGNDRGKADVWCRMDYVRDNQRPIIDMVSEWLEDEDLLVDEGESIEDSFLQDFYSRQAQGDDQNGYQNNHHNGHHNGYSNGHQNGSS
ncbi:MAG: hypothetical protein Q9222_002972 [Ikaeria aurantiellina]